MSVVREGIICESLKPGTVIEGDGCPSSGWSRYEVTGIAGRSAPARQDGMPTRMPI